MKVFAALGPGDIVAAHRAPLGGRPSLSETSIVYSGQMVEFCREKGLALLAISSNERIDAARDGDLRLENRPRKFTGRRGVFYHYSRISYAVYLAVRAKMFGADLAIVDSGTAHYFALALFRL